METAMKAVRIAVLLLVFAVVASFAEDTNTLPTTITVDGVTYSNVTWRTVTPAMVTIFHETGVASLSLDKLPPELQRRFGYDPQKAAAYRARESAAEQQHLIEIQAQEQLRRQREAEALEVAQKDQEARQQEAQMEQARQQLAAIQKANAKVKVIEVLHVNGGISLLSDGEYAALLALSNQTTVCAHFDDGGKQYLENANQKYADWMAQQNSGGQQLQITGQPGTILLYGGKGSVRVGGGGYVPGYTTVDSHPTAATPQPVFAVYAVYKEDASCYTLKGSREAGQSGGIKQYSWR
jgi:hypothetical protein